MNLRHYADHHVTEITIPVKPQAIDHKPNGLWVSDDDDIEASWPKWCEAEGFGMGRLTHTHDIELATNPNVIIIQSSHELMEFHRRFSTTPEWARGMRYPYELINWREVAERWDGIVITPYIWSCRLDGDAARWYYGWDCASGCIWHPRAVASIRLLHVRDLLEVRGDPFKAEYPKMLDHGEYDWNVT